MTTVRHDVSVLAGNLTCPCGWSLPVHLYGGKHAIRLAHAHVASPDVPTLTLLAFVSGRPTLGTEVSA